MSKSHAKFVIPLALLGSPPAIAAAAQTSFFFSTGDPDEKMATATRPDTPGVFEIELADDFVLTHSTSITSATFTGLLPPGASPANVIVEIYRVFPLDSTVPPSGNVPSRVNSPSDVAFEERDNGTGLSFTSSLVMANFVAANSVQPGGIHPIPGFQTGGDGAVTGDEVRFDVTFTTPFDLPASIILVPQVQLDDGNFLWLSAASPIQSPARHSRLASPTFKAGPAMKCSIRTGCVLGKISLAATHSRPSTQRSRSPAPWFPSRQPGP